MQRPRSTRRLRPMSRWHCRPGSQLRSTLEYLESQQTAAPTPCPATPQSASSDLLANQARGVSFLLPYYYYADATAAAVAAEQQLAPLLTHAAPQHAASVARAASSCCALALGLGLHGQHGEGDHPRLADVVQPLQECRSAGVQECRVQCRSAGVQDPSAQRTAGRRRGRQGGAAWQPGAHLRLQHV